ncbi:hypothetical protein [uncultured Tateyamaria sp.]|uniref:AbiU2 domain-containing protein n=1 Tax=uncultured Tateyamaria sp. TaxID=455651 RepID=UPI00263623B1|nr:hypothetical protein [uncultured Tateyamaria sp.]
MNIDAEQYFELVKQDVFSARIEWRLYRSLFGTNPETVEFLNKISGRTANTLERVLFERTLLNLRKLTDRPENTRWNEKSVTLRGLSHFFFVEDAQLKRLQTQAIEKASFAKNWSDKKIAHSDLDHRTNAVKLSSASRERVDNALEAAAEVIKHVAKEHYGYTQITHPIPDANDERWFLLHLFEGARAFDEKERLSREYSASGRYVERDSLYDFPSWLDRPEPPFDID